MRRRRRLAREHVGEAGHPARLPVRRHRRRLDGSRAWPFFDKDTLPLKRPGIAAGVRIVPGGSSVRDGAYLGAGRDLHAADVRQHRRVDRRADADRFARAGRIVRADRARACTSAPAAQIGGVIEPVGALPVIIEDDVLVGGNTGIYEGAIIKSRAVIACRHDPHRIDARLRPRERRDHQADRRPAARDSRRRGRRAGRARGHAAATGRSGACRSRRRSS